MFSVRYIPGHTSSLQFDFSLYCVHVLTTIKCTRTLVVRKFSYFTLYSVTYRVLRSKG